MWGYLFHTEQELKWHEHRHHNSGRCSERIQRGNKGRSIRQKNSIIVAPHKCFFKQDGRNFYKKDKKDFHPCDVRTLWCLLNLTVGRQEVIEFMGRQIPDLTKQWMLNLVERYESELKQRGLKEEQMKKIQISKRKSNTENQASKTNSSQSPKKKRKKLKK